jgi:hypothetical protein
MLRDMYARPCCTWYGDDTGLRECGAWSATGWRAHKGLPTAPDAGACDCMLHAGAHARPTQSFGVLRAAVFCLQRFPAVAQPLREPSDGTTSNGSTFEQLLGKRSRVGKWGLQGS